MVMLRCLIVAVGAALARSDARRNVHLEKLELLFSAVVKGDYSFLTDVDTIRDLLDDGFDVTAPPTRSIPPLVHQSAATTVRTS
jgi:hypothetical protein